jgi:dTDP-4-amino-4,6-dideoxygalactose transaminase
MKKMHIPLLRLQYTDEEIKYVQDGVKEILLSGYLTMADKVGQFEKEFAQWVGTKYALGTNSGTSSLEIPLRAIGVEGKTVICPSNTYMATPIAAVHAGAKVAFVDSEVDNLQMSPESLRNALERMNDVAAVTIVHVGGIISPHYWQIKKICDDYGIVIIEDAAHAHGAKIDGKSAGTLGLAGSFSFYPTKVLVTAEGGMVTTDNEEIHKQGIILREHGKSDHSVNRHTEFGYNWRFSELHALLGLQQMRIADKILSDRRTIAKWYDELLKGTPGLKLIKIPANVDSAYYKYICYLDEKIDRKVFKKRMADEFGISLTGEVYSDPCHSQPVFERYPDKLVIQKNEHFEGTNYLCKHHICPPLYPGLTREEIEYTADSLNRCLGTF